MVDRIYTAEASATGGRNGRAGTADGRLDVQLASPGAPNRPAGSVDPEQLFATAYAACYGGAFELAAKQAGVSLGAPVKVTAKVTLLKTDPAPHFGLEVALVVDVVGIDDATGEALAEKAHAICPYSNSIRGNVDISTAIRPAAAAA